MKRNAQNLNPDCSVSDITNKQDDQIVNQSQTIIDVTNTSAFSQQQTNREAIQATYFQNDNFQEEQKQCNLCDDNQEILFTEKVEQIENDIQENQEIVFYNVNEEQKSQQQNSLLEINQSNLQFQERGINDGQVIDIQNEQSLIKDEQQSELVESQRDEFKKKIHKKKQFKRKKRFISVKKETD